MTTSEPLLEHTLSVLRERDIAIAREELNPAFDDSTTGANSVRWTRDRLGPETLLSKEEIDLYTKLDVNGTAARLQAGHDLSTVMPFLDADIQRAIESLKVSNATIDEQSEVLRQRSKQLGELQRRNRQSEVQQKKAREQLHRRHALEKQHAGVAVEELWQDLKSKLSQVEDQCQVAGKTITPVVTEILNEDDRLLKKAENLASDVQSGDDGSKATIERTERMAAMLTGFIAQEVRCRLDRIYLQALSEVPSGDHLDHRDALHHQTSLQQELESLYSEVKILAEMSVQQEYTGRILQQSKHRYHQSEAASMSKILYINDTLTYLIDLLKQATERLDCHRSYKAALDSLSVMFRDAFYTDAPPSPAQAKSRNLQAGVSVQTQKIAAVPGRSLADLPSLDGSQSLKALLRHLGVSLSDEASAEEFYTLVSEAVKERRGKMAGVLSSLESNMEPSEMHLPTIDCTSQLLSAALHADSIYCTPSLTDTVLDETLDRLEARIGTTGKAFEDVDLDILNLHDRAQERFMDQWP